MADSGSVLAAAAIWRSFCLCLLMAAPSWGQLDLWTPVNLSVKSHDFHTVLKWDVHNSSETTRFNVDFREYMTAEWKPVCVNVWTHYCDLSNVFVATEDQVGGYYARVKAVTGLQESEFAQTNRFTFAQNATLGAPIVQLTADGSQLTVEVKYPPLNSASNSRLRESLYYHVYCRHPNQTDPICLALTAENPLHQEDFVEGTVCVSAEVEISAINLIGKKSNETCLRMSQRNYSAAAAAISTVVIVLLLIFIFVGIYLWKCKKKLVLPKSLAQVIVSERPYNVMNSKREESSVCIVVKPEEVTSVPDDSQDFQVQEETSISSDTLDPRSALIDGGSSEHVNTDLSDPYAAKINIGIIDQNSDCTDHIDQEAGSDQGSSHDLCKTHCDSIKLSCTADNWGYDKPHVPLDMF
ncbi:interferon gamma receptor 1-like isoform X3 [Hemitrygon akajei]|uniref:interferon gamma receptor 1-like isoform X3 n=1 Tax=Hemitrygon akajei TaxID=2704970 RepID=UPI003BF941D2